MILYLGLLRIPVSRLFTVTGWMILLLAAGLAAQGAGFLVQANLLPPLGEQLCIHPPKTLDQARLRDDDLRLHFFARPCTA